jgi:hypothetical protein
VIALAIDAARFVGACVATAAALAFLFLVPNGGL